MRTPVKPSLSRGANRGLERSSGRRKHLVPITILILLTPLSLFAQTASSVELQSLFKASSTHGKLYAVSFEYNFVDRQDVYIEGLGIAPPKGKFNFYSFDPHLEFRESQNGKVLDVVSLAAATLEMGLALIELPKESDFSEASRRGSWTKTKSFQVSAADRLNKLFPLGYSVYERNQKNNYLTTYRALDGLTIRQFLI